MTNFEHIKNSFTEIDLAYCMFPHDVKRDYQPRLFFDKIFGVYDKWACSVSQNLGNMAKGTYSNDRVVTEDPSIWSFHMWMYPSGAWKDSGRTRIVSFSQWLNMQYKPEEWEEDKDKILNNTCINEK